MQSLVLRTVTTSLLAYILWKLIAWCGGPRKLKSSLLPAAGRMSRELSQELPSSVSAPRPLALAVRQPIDCVATSGQLSTLDDGVCLIILRFLNQNDLCLSINVSHRFRDLGCSDIVWKRLCQLRWAHMQNMPKMDLGTWELPLFWRADYTGIELTLSEEASIESVSRIWQH